MLHKKLLSDEHVSYRLNACKRNRCMSYTHVKALVGLFTATAKESGHHPVS